MKFEYTGRHVEVTPAIRLHVEEHFNKLENFLDGAEARAHIRIEVEKNRHIGEIIVHWQNHTLTATDTNDDMYLALSRAIDKIETQARKLKKKIIDKSHHRSRTTRDAIPTLAINTDTTKKVKENGKTANAVSTDSQPRVINSPLYQVKPMTAEEAAMKLTDSTEEQFVVFRDADTEQVNVLYKRKDGNFGLIEP